ncbi:MAG: hypothetical protein ACR2HV_08115 [Acidimicrobiales bacterium]
MYIEKRWIVPATLSLLLLSALFAALVLLLGTRFSQASGNLGPTELASAGPRSLVPDPSCATPVTALAATTPEVVPAAPAAPQSGGFSSRQAPEEVVHINTAGSDRTQINTRGFGDIGMQFQDVNINAPITNVHISNEGNNNSNNVVIGDHDSVVSNQEDLESNRSDAPEQPTAVSTDTTTPPPADAAPTANSSSGREPEHVTATAAATLPAA